MKIVLDINPENEQQAIDVLKKVEFINSIEVINDTSDLNSQELSTSSNKSFDEVWSGEHNNHWDNFLSDK